MTNRTRKLRLFQFSLLIVGMLIVIYTFLQNKNENQLEIISKDRKNQINESLKKNSDGNDIFYDITYNGIDLAGNRYVLKSKEAVSNKTQGEIIQMNEVDAFFYFKDGTVLKVKSKKGVYNNKTLDIKFEESVKANYQESSLYANEANYSNSESYLSISGDVKIKDIRGEIFTDNLFFDLKNQTVDIKSSSENNVKANIKVNEKKF
tara:strand:+ start:2835 stop:3452 length:618 start_codon:yes stop_codon:yes gene_type:complete